MYVIINNTAINAFQRITIDSAENKKDILIYAQEEVDA